MTINWRRCTQPENVISRNASSGGTEPIVARNNSSRGFWGAGRLQMRANSGMMRTCGTWRVLSRVYLPIS